MAAAPTFKSFGAIAASTGADITITIPTFAQDDICLILCWVRDADDTATISGFTNIKTWDRSTSARYWLFGRRMQTGDSTSAVFDKSGATGDTYGVAILYQGCIKTGTAWDVTGTVATGTADPATITGITTLIANALVVLALGGEDNATTGVAVTGTDPAAYTEHYDESPTGTDGAVSFSEAARAAPGATGSLSADWLGTAPPGWGGVVVSLRPPDDPVEGVAASSSSAIADLGGAGILEGVAAGTAVGAGDLTAASAEGPVQGVAAGVAWATADLAGAGELAGAAAASSAAVADLGGAGELAGATAGTAAGTADIAGTAVLAGVAAGTSAAAADLSGTGVLDGVAASSSAGTGELAGAGALEGVAAGSAWTVGNLADLQGAVEGVAAGYSSALAELAGAGALAGIAAASSWGRGDLALPPVQSATVLPPKSYAKVTSGEEREKRLRPRVWVRERVKPFGLRRG